MSGMRNAVMRQLKLVTLALLLVVVASGCDSYDLGVTEPLDECRTSADCPDDEQFCTGDPLCLAGECVFSGDPCLTSEVCDEDSDTCLACLNDADCDDGAFCNGPESCVDGVCREGSPPCPEETTCNEETDACEAEGEGEEEGEAEGDGDGEGEGDGACETNADCDDGDLCTIDSCNPETGCVFDPLLCPDGIECVDGDCVGLVWWDEFDGSAIDAAKWEHMIGDGTTYGLPAGWGNNEWQYYTDRPENSFVAGGYLHIAARQELFEGHNYTSARLRTKNKQDFLYGRIEARMRLPSGQGMWPAFWMLSSDDVYGGWAASGEIDIMEAVNVPTTIHGVIHFGGEWPNQASSSGAFSDGTDFSDAFHTFGVEWGLDAIRWYVDGVLYHSATSADWHSDGAPGNVRAPFDQPFHLLLNVAIGGDFPGPPDGSAEFPQEMLVDWVRVYELVVDEPVDECRTSADCPDDELFCTGDPLCQSGECVFSGDPCMAGEVCDEDTDTCLACLSDSDCDDGVFCNGPESCVDGVCRNGSPPCPEETTCNEETDACEPERESNIQVVGRMTTREALRPLYSGELRELFYIYGRLENTGTAAARAMSVAFRFYDSDGTEITAYGPYTDVYGDRHEYYFAGSSQNYLLPDHEGWFVARIEPYDGPRIATFTLELDWYDEDNYVPEGSVVVLNDAIQLEGEEDRVVVSATIENTGSYSAYDTYACVAALNADGDIVHVFDVAPDLPKDTYCHDGVNMAKCLVGDAETVVSGMETERDFPMDEVASYETKVHWEVCANLAPASGEVEFVARSQTNLAGDDDGVCATFHRVVGDEEDKFFGGCGFSLTFRGFNIGVMSPEDGTILDFRTFDTWLEADADDRMGAYIPTIPDGAIVLLSIADEGTRCLSEANRQVIADALGSSLIGEIGFRDGLAMIGIKGSGEPPIELSSDYSEEGFEAVEARMRVSLPIE